VSGLPIDERITARYAELSPQERQAADALLAHLEDLATYRASELAELAGVSKATMSRLFRRLDFEGFHDLRDHLRTLRGEGVPVALDAAPSLRERAEHEIETLRRGFAVVDETALGTAAQRIAGARRVTVIGMRSSYPVALHLRQQLAQVRDGVLVGPQPGQSVAEEVMGLDEHDMLVLVAFRRRPERLGTLLRLAAEEGVPTALVAAPPARTLGRRAPWWLECPLAAHGAFDSYGPVMSLVAVLADAVLEHREADGERRVEAISSAYRALRETEGR
jgi:DNA-binding MurR/RpiR family transcriptional regulator